ncbi:hypothetical protein A2U01_0079434, partial [Trifolium medium]|nr:hypothetical protein [Trifolium medium]
HGHVTEECIHLKDAIEVLIREGHLKRFVQNKENPRPEPHQASNVEEEKLASGGQDLKQVAMCISIPEDFLVPEHLEDKYAAPIFSKWENFP